MSQIKRVIGNVELAQKRTVIDPFGHFDIEDFEKSLQNEGENYWQVKGEKKALELFYSAAQKVPAYKDFLKKHNINPENIRTIKDFKNVPETNKKNYINVYPLEKRCWDGNLSTAKLIATSSGTSGEPTFWPRGEYQELESGVTHELIYRYFFEINKHKTLLVICFPMGVYVSGLATLLPSWLISSKHYDVTCMTIGNNKAEALRVIKSLQPEYEQIVLIGHPFFVKDVIETGRVNGIDWSDQRLKIMFCSGSFNETWRNYVATKAGMSTDVNNIISTYGSSEMLLMGHETPLSVYTRRLMEKNKEMRSLLSTELSSSVPNLFQYNPLQRYIESVNNELIFTSASGLPLIRFNLHDSGNVIKFEDVKSKIDIISPNWKKEITKGKSNYPIWQLPFVTLYGRSDYTVKFYAANIYPENIEIALNSKNFLNKITGKFVMTKGYHANMDEYLEINIELNAGTDLPSEEFVQKLQDHIVKTLKQINREYLDASTKLDKDLRPKVKFWKYQDEKFFKPGLKPKFILS